MDRLKELEVEREDARAAVKALLAGASREKRPLSVEERESIATLTETLEAVGATLAAEYKAREYDHSAPAVDTPEGDVPAAVLRQRAKGPGAIGRRYQDLFGAPKASAFPSNVDFLKAVHSLAQYGIGDPRLVTPRAAMNESVGSEGGFAVPSPLAQTWLDNGLESEVVRPRATIWPMTADTLDIPGWDDYDHSGGSIAGFKMSWIPELGTQVDTTGKMRSATLRALKGILSTQFSNEMLADGGQSFQEHGEQKMGEAVSWTLDDRFINGTGVGQPLGILNDPALITITKEASQPANTFVLENALKMYERLYPGGYSDAVWIINHSVVPQLYTMVVKIKNVAGTENVGGSAAPYFTVSGDGKMRLLGLPIVVTEKTPALSSKGDVILASLKNYAIGLRKEIGLEASRHAGWSTDSTFWRIVVRVAGMGTWSKVFTPKAGSTRSWVVTLEAR